MNDESIPSSAKGYVEKYGSYFLMKCENGYYWVDNLGYKFSWGFIKNKKKALKKMKDYLSTF